MNALTSKLTLWEILKLYWISNPKPNSYQLSSHCTVNCEYLVHIGIHSYPCCLQPSDILLCNHTTSNFTPHPTLVTFYIDLSAIKLVLSCTNLHPQLWCIHSIWLSKLLDLIVVLWHYMCPRGQSPCIQWIISECTHNLFTVVNLWNSRVLIQSWFTLTFLYKQVHWQTSQNKPYSKHMLILVSFLMSLSTLHTHHYYK